MLKPNTMKEMKKLQLEITPSQMENLDSLIQKCGLTTRKELFNNAMTLFAWAVSESEKGNRVASYDEENDRIERLVYPALFPLYEAALAEKARSAETTKKRKERLGLDVRPGGQAASAQ